MNGFLFTPEEVMASPSIRAGLLPQKETYYRREGCKIISEVGSSLGFKSNPTIATACVFFHRFYMVESFQAYPREIMALSCLFLAGKVEETPKKCMDLCTAASNKYEHVFSKYSNLMKLCNEVTAHERVLLVALKFDLVIDLPYDALMEYIKFFPLLTKDQENLVTQTAWTFINDSYYTTLCLTTHAQMIAIALLHLALTAKSIDTVRAGGSPCWWSCDVENWPVQAVDKLCHMVLDFYDVTKVNPVLENGRLID